MADSFVQVAVDGAGKKIDNAALAREVPFDGTTATTVYRQRVTLSADDNPALQVGVSGESGRGALETKTRDDDIYGVLVEIRDLLTMVIGQ